MEDSSKSYKVVGWIIFSIGVVLLVNMLLRIFSVDFISDYWQVILTFAGLGIILCSNSLASIGALVLIIGLIFIAAEFGWLDTTFGRTLLALAAICVGLVVINRRKG
jgi:hypothetical protein